MFAELDAARWHHIWGELAYALRHVSQELGHCEDVASWDGPASVVRAWQAQQLRSQAEHLRHQAQSLECSGGL